MAEPDPGDPGFDEAGLDEAGFDEAAYLLLFPDVAAAVAASGFASGREHFLAAGRAEIAAGVRRDPRLQPGRPNEAVPVLVALAGCATAESPRPWAFLHEDDRAVADGFAAALFEDAYPLACSDLGEAVRAGSLPSPFAHWAAFGRAEILAGRRSVAAVRLPDDGGDGPLGIVLRTVRDWAPLLRACARGVLPAEADWYEPGLLGRLDEAGRRGLRGWAFDPARPGEAVVLSVLVDGEVAGRTVANSFRPDLLRHGIGDGRHAFAFAFRPPLSPLRHVVAVREEAVGEGAGGRPLPRSPSVLPGAGRFDGPARAAVAAVLEADGTAAELGERIEFVAGQLDALLRRRSATAGAGEERLRARQVRRRWGGDAREDAAGPAPRALVIDGTLPVPNRDAGSAAVLSHAESLKRLGFEVVLAAADMAGTPEGMAALDALGIEACCRPWFGTVEEVLRLQGHGFDLIYLHRVDTALCYLALVRRLQPRARVVFSVADLHHLRLARQAEVENRPELAAAARRVREQELLAAGGADAVITHSPHEAGLLAPFLPPGRVHTVPWAVPPAPGPAPFAERSGLCFVGSYGHAPNLDGALWLLEEVLPALWAGHPGIGCKLVGSAMPPILREGRPGVEALGAVPDLGAVLGAVRLTVAPLLFGAGIKGKVLDSLAAGVPCVCTPVAAEGLALGPALRSLVAEGAGCFAAAVARLHDDEALHAACRREGLDLVSRDFGSARIDALMAGAVGIRRDGPPPP